MKRIQYSLYKRDTGNASGKAKKDCSETLARLGFEHLYMPSDKQFIRVLQQYFSLIRLLFDKEKKVFVLQYPAIHSMFYPLVKKVVKKRDASIAIIHDLSALQNDDYKCALKDEIAFLNVFKYVIVPNEHMKALLIDNGLNSTIVNMEIYDYLHDNNKPIKLSKFENKICFAGNLQKSKFLKDINQLKKLNFLLYGKDGNGLVNENVEYKGCLPSEELVYSLEGDYGLVWDGDSIDECSGKVGKYLLYNSPHKLSSYISAGKPVVTWDKAAIADYVKANNIGIVVSSLRELLNIDLEIKFAEYKQNILSLKRKLAKGFYLEKAINHILKVENL